jgi:IS30 family transposase
VAQARLSVRKIPEVLRLKNEARLSDGQIAVVLGSARSTVQECLRRARTAGLWGRCPSWTTISCTEFAGCRIQNRR